MSTFYIRQCTEAWLSNLRQEFPDDKIDELRRVVFDIVGRETDEERVYNILAGEKGKLTLCIEPEFESCNYIECIKLVRQLSGAGLRDAKDIVDSAMVKPHSFEIFKVVDSYNQLILDKFNKAIMELRKIHVHVR